MLDEARRRHERSEDVVVAAIQAQQSGDLLALVRTCSGAAVVHSETGELLKIFGVADGAIFGVNHRTAFTADFEGLRRGCKFEGNVQSKALASFYLKGSSFVVSETVSVNDQSVRSEWL